MSNRVSRISEMAETQGMRSTVKIFLVFALCFIGIGQQTTLQAQDPAQGSKSVPSAPVLEAPRTTPSPGPVPIEYLINRGDVLDVYVYDVPELSHTYNVGPTGDVSMPLLETPVQAVGLTPDQFARALEGAYRQAGRLRRPEIAVSVKQPAHALSVTVDGAVRNPAVLLVSGRTKLIDVLTQCGGVTNEAGTTVTITRGPIALRDLAAEGEPATPILTLDFKKVSDGSDPASATSLWPGDRVTVGMAGVYYVMGEVKAPGGYNLKTGRDELTVLRAIALAGDLTVVAKKDKALIIRKDPKAPHGRDEIKLDLKSILIGKSPDPILQADDILFVPGSNSKKALHALSTVPATVVGQAGTAAIIYH
jgi:polysaccharide export outer membrane protein